MNIEKSSNSIGKYYTIQIESESFSEKISPYVKFLNLIGFKTMLFIHRLYYKQNNIMGFYRLAEKYTLKKNEK